MTADAMPDTDIPGLINWAARYLEQNGVIKARLNAENLLSHCTGRSRTELYAYHDRPVTGLEREDFTAALRRRAAHEPLQYITGRKGFRHIELEVDGRVLIPRPETEMLVEKALCILRKMPGHPVVVDVGTGSGCIALSLALECPAAVVYATDISEEALEAARANARRLELETVVSFSQGDLLDALPAGLAGGIDLIVCNPPYVREEEFGSLPPEVREHEPYISLVAGPSGTEAHLRLMRQARAWLSERGCLLMEGGEDQVHGLAREAAGFGYGAASVTNDLNGRPRVVEMHRGPGPGDCDI